MPAAWQRDVARDAPDLAVDLQVPAIRHATFARFTSRAPADDAVATQRLVETIRTCLATAWSPVSICVDHACLSVERVPYMHEPALRACRLPASWPEPPLVHDGIVLMMPLSHRHSAPTQRAQTRWIALIGGPAPELLAHLRARNMRVIAAHDVATLDAADRAAACVLVDDTLLSTAASVAEMSHRYWRVCFLAPANDDPAVVERADRLVRAYLAHGYAIEHIPGPQLPLAERVALIVDE